MAWMVVRQEPLDSPHTLLAFVDTGLARGVLAPLLLYRVMSQQGAAGRNHVIPPNMISWTIAGVLVAVAFRFAHRLAEGEAQLPLAVAASGLLLGLFVLSTQTGPFSQAIGVLRIENAIALFELGVGGQEMPLAIHAGLVAVFVLTVGLFAVYLRWLNAPPPAEPGMRGPAL
jgi:hydrogenase-4 membrane subunit HyfE